MKNVKVIFVCHGNICRSAMAEFIMKYLLSKDSLSCAFTVLSAGVSDEEHGNDIYPPAKKVLTVHGIPFSGHSAHRITEAEFMDADYIYAMDSSNYMALTRRFGNASGKISMFLDKDVEDPWYSGDFNAVFNDIFRGCSVLLEKFHQIYDGLCRLH